MAENGPAPAFLPADIEVSILQAVAPAGGAASAFEAHAAELAAEGEEESGGRSASSSSSCCWTTATVVKAKLRKAGGESGSKAKAPQHLLRFADGTEQWVCLSETPFLVHPPAQQEEDAEPTLTCCAVMAMHYAGSVPPQAPKRKGIQSTPGSLDQQRKWNAQVRRASSVSEVVFLVNQSSEWFDFMNVAGSLHGLARRAPFAPTDEAGAWQAIHRLLEHAANDALLGYGPQAIANICWAMAKVGMHVSTAEPVAVRVLGLAVRRAYEDFRQATLKAEAQAEAAWDPSLWGGWKPQEIANLCWALNRSCGPKASPDVRRLLGVLAQGALLAKWVGFSAQELTNTLASLCAFGLGPPLLVKRCLTKVQRHPDMFKPQEKCQVLHAATRAGTPRPQLRPLLLAVLADASKSELRGFNCTDITNLTWALGARANMRDEFDEERALLESCADFLLQAIVNVKEFWERWSPANIASFMYSLAKLGVVDLGLLRLAEEAWEAWLSPDTEESPPAGAVTPYTLSLVVRVCARVGHPAVGLQQLVCKRAHKALKATVAARERGGEATDTQPPWREMSVLNVLFSAACALAIADAKNEEEGATERPSVEVAAVLAKALLAVLQSTLRAMELGILNVKSRQRLSLLYPVYSVLCCWGERAGGGGLGWALAPEVLAVWRAAYAAPATGTAASSVDHRKFSELHREIGHALRFKVLPATLPEGWSLEDEAECEGLSVDLLTTSKTSGVRVAIEADGPFHFVCQVRQLRSSVASGKAPVSGWLLNGQSRMKHYLLRRLAGVSPVSVSKFAWKACEGDEQRESLLAELIRGAAAAAPAKKPGAAPVAKSTEQQGQVKKKRRKE